jgi:hypothetical protein
MKRILRRYLGLTTDCWMLGAEASLVVPLRLAGWRAAALRQRSRHG